MADEKISTSPAEPDSAARPAAVHPAPRPPADDPADLPEREPTFDDLGKLTPADRVEYHKATLAYSEAYRVYETTVAAAGDRFAAPFAAFTKAKADYDSRSDAKDEAVRNAKEKLAQLRSCAAEAGLAEKLADADLVKNHVDSLQRALDDYKKSAGEVIGANAALEAAAADLRKVSEPDLRTPSRAAQAMAEAQYKLDNAQARALLDSAVEAFEAKRVEFTQRIAERERAPAEAPA